jgi:predicted RNase H-like nuclease
VITTLIGIDCATKAKNIGLAYGFFEKEKAQIDEVTICSNDIDLVGTIVEWTKRSEYTLIALDAPLGWPVDLGKSLNIHEAGKPIKIEPNQLFRRETDRLVKTNIGKQPLDVGADRIARTAHSALSLLEEIREKTGEAVPLAWKPNQSPGVYAIEVYPAATLLAHAIRPPSYKVIKGQDVRRTLVNTLSNHIALPSDTSLMEMNDDAIDAALCVLAGADFLLGDVIEPNNMDSAKREGWIWVRKPV